MSTPITYYEAYPDLLPGAMFFDCQRISATLRPEHCASRHKEACKASRYETGDVQDVAKSFSACRSCPIGARHAAGNTDGGEEVEIGVAPLPTNVCARCSRGGMRLIKRRLCVSCYNREREANIGVNARGTKPVDFKPLFARYVGIEDGESARWVSFKVQNDHEPLVIALRECGSVALSEEHPAQVAWDDQHGFHYVDDEDRPLSETVAKSAAIKLSPCGNDERPAEVRQTVQLLHADTLRRWLSMTDATADLGSMWEWQPFGCESCHRGVLRARNRAGRLQCQCPACGEEAA